MPEGRERGGCLGGRDIPSSPARDSGWVLGGAPANVSAAEVFRCSVVICLRYGGKYNKCLHANLLQNPTVKDFVN